jgi:chromosome partitioning protein
MPVVAVVNRKGGSGKSTLATHVAACWAHRGARVTLGDVDRQQSTRTWLRERAGSAAPQAAAIAGWTVDSRSFVRPPAGTDLVVMDTPGGLTGLDLARVAMYADAILMPLCNSIFDRESAADCLAELRTLPRVATGRCRVGVLGMRIDTSAEAASTLRAWADAQRLPLIGVLGESMVYVRCIEQGLTLFDLPAAVVRNELAQWEPILAWLRPILDGPAVPAQSTAVAASAGHGSEVRPRPAPVLAATPRRAPGESRPGSAVTRLFDALPIPRFLQRGS